MFAINSYLKGSICVVKDSSWVWLESLLMVRTIVCSPTCLFFLLRNQLSHAHTFTLYSEQACFFFCFFFFISTFISWAKLFLYSIKSGHKRFRVGLDEICRHASTQAILCCGSNKLNLGGKWPYFKTLQCLCVLSCELTVTFVFLYGSFAHILALYMLQ